LLGGALLYRSARSRLSLRWFIAVVAVGALSGLLLGRAATLPPGGHTEIIQRGSFALCFACWWFLIKAILTDRPDRD
jgi:hypothetical protein